MSVRVRVSLGLGIGLGCRVSFSPPLPKWRSYRDYHHFTLCIDRAGCVCFVRPSVRLMRAWAEAFVTACCRLVVIKSVADIGF